MPTLYRFLSASAALKTLESLKLRLSRLTSLNDPFDCCPEFTGTVKYPEGLKDQMGQLFLERRSRSMGVLCFTRTWEKHLMWSHYADHHRGIALVFKFMPKPDLLKVTYSKARAVVDIDLLQAGAENAVLSPGFAESLTTKSLEWRYEKETRLLIPVDKCVPQDGYYFIPFEKNMLVGAILGVRCEIPASYIHRIFAGHQLTHAKVWQTKKKPGAFSIIRVERPDEAMS